MGCIVQYQTKKAHLITRKMKITIPTPHFPLPLMLIIPIKFQRIVTFRFGGEGGGQGKMVSTFHFLATLNFINGPLLVISVLLEIRVVPL